MHIWSTRCDNINLAPNSLSLDLEHFQRILSVHRRVHGDDLQDLLKTKHLSLDLEHDLAH